MILELVKKDLGRIWEGFGKIWEDLGRFGKIWELVKKDFGIS